MCVTCKKLWFTMASIGDRQESMPDTEIRLLEELSSFEFSLLTKR